jgi:hypothetical protein
MPPKICAFCSRQLARQFVRVGLVVGHACDDCVEGAALALARWSRERAEETKPGQQREAAA